MDDLPAIVRLLDALRPWQKELVTVVGYDLRSKKAPGNQPGAFFPFSDHSIGEARLPQATIVEGLASDAPTLT